jgi:hypothetical protein
MQVYLLLTNTEEEIILDNELGRGDLSIDELRRIEKHNTQKDSSNVIDTLAAITNDELNLTICKIINMSIQFANSELDSKVFIPEFSDREFSDILMNWWMGIDNDSTRDETYEYSG